MWGWDQIEKLQWKTIPEIFVKIKKLNSDVSYLLDKIIEIENKMTSKEIYAVYDDITNAFLSDIEHEAWAGFGITSVLKVSHDGETTGHYYGSIDRASFASAAGALQFIDEFSKSFSNEEEWKFSVYKVKLGNEKIIRFGEVELEQDIASIKRVSSVENIKPLKFDPKPENSPEDRKYYDLKFLYEQVIARINKLELDSDSAISFADLHEDDNGYELIQSFLKDITELVGE